MVKAARRFAGCLHGFRVLDVATEGSGSFSGCCDLTSRFESSSPTRGVALLGRLAEASVHLWKVFPACS